MSVVRYSICSCELKKFGLAGVHTFLIVVPPFLRIDRKFEQLKTQSTSATIGRQMRHY